MGEEIKINFEAAFDLLKTPQLGYSSVAEIIIARKEGNQLTQEWGKKWVKDNRLDHSILRRINYEENPGMKYLDIGFPNTSKDHVVFMLSNMDTWGKMKYWSG